MANTGLAMNSTTYHLIWWVCRTKPTFSSFLLTGEVPIVPRSWLIAVIPPLLGDTPEIFNCFNLSLAPHDVDLPRNASMLLLLITGELLISTTAGPKGEPPWLTCLLLIIALLAAAASDWLRCLKNDLNPLLLLSALLGSPFVGELQGTGLSFGESPDLLRDFLKLKKFFSPVEPLLGLYSVPTWANSSSATSGKANALESYKIRTSHLTDPDCTSNVLTPKYSNKMAMLAECQHNFFVCLDGIHWLERLSEELIIMFQDITKI